MICANTYKQTSMATSPVYPGSSAHIPAVPPHLTPPWMDEGQEKRVAQNRRRRDAIRGLVLQHPLQEVEKLVVFYPIRQQILLKKHG